MTNKQRIKALEEYIAIINSNNTGNLRMYFCYMSCMLKLTSKQKLKELKRFRLLQACKECGGEYMIFTHGISAFINPLLYISKNMKVYNKAYNRWKIEIAKRAIELLSESE